jgi:hypothetical protein
MLTIEKRFKFTRPQPKSKPGTPKPRRELPVRVPRVAKLMALAIRFDELIRTGVAHDQAELAELGQVTRPRVTQIMNLLALAPEIQEELLFLARGGVGREEITERSLREISAEASWERQKAMWKEIGSNDGLGFSGGRSWPAPQIRSQRL